jgi:hypothetical protein
VASRGDHIAVAWVTMRGRLRVVTLDPSKL